MTARLLKSAKHRVGEAVFADRRAFRAARRRLAFRHLRGSGLEIGALDKPLMLPRGARARYVDRYGVAELRAHYPELADRELVEVDVVDDGERLATIASESVNFVVANHFFEHCEDPIGTLDNHLRVLKPGGILYAAVPDKRFTFDRSRPVTTLEHVVLDHEVGPERSRRAHYEEWAQEVDRVNNGIPDAEVPLRARELEETSYSIHFHVWTPKAWLRLVSYCGTEAAMPLEVVAGEQNAHEFITVLAKTG
jgi:SAM-dependent methyltransferase